MKRIFFYLIVSLFISTSHSFAQCLTNGTFANACGLTTTIDGLCPTWTTACGNGWIRSNGTPQMNPYTYTVADGTFTSYYAYMYSMITSSGSGDTSGEGMFTPYYFQMNTYYDVKVDFTTYVNAGEPTAPANGHGYVYFDAANGLTQYTLGSTCDSQVPNGMPTQVIGTYQGLTPTPIIAGGIYQASFTFKPILPYTQFWVYPYADGVEQYNLNVYRVQICPSCTAIADYPVGVLPLLMAGATVTIGGGPTGSLAEPQPSLATTVTASQYIKFEPGFSAHPTGNGSLVASIVPCGQNGSSLATLDNFDSLAIVSSNPPIPDATGIKPSQAGQAAIPVSSDSLSGSKLQIYPTVSSGAFTLTGSPADLNNANIIVVDESGRTVYSMHNAAGATIPLDLGNLANGLYFVQIRQQNKVTTQKIIINK
jgi:hypothetical protein